MPLKKVSNRVEVLEVEGTKIHAVKPKKADWDEYADELFERDAKTGEFRIKSSRGIRQLYRLCLKKLENVEIEKDDGTIEARAEITDIDEIVGFLMGLGDAEAGRTIDNWLLGLGELSAAEAKN